MKKISRLMAVVFAALFSTSVFAQTTIVFSEHEPLGNMRTRFLADFFDNIEKESKGRVKIEAHWAGELSSSYDALKTVKDGSAAQFATVVPEYAAKDLPLHQLFKSFPVGPAGQKQVDFFRGIYKKAPALLKELDEANLHPVLIATGYPVGFFSAKPISDLGDIKGQVWRSASFWHRDFLTNAGAIPITMPWGQQVFDALADGTMTGLMVNIDSGYDIEAYKPAPYILYSKDLWLGHEYIIAMNKDTWNSLSKKDQKAIEKAAAKSYKTLAKLMEDSLAETLKQLENAGATIRELSPEEVELWKSVTGYHAIQDRWLSEQNLPEGKTVIEVMRKGIEK